MAAKSKSRARLKDIASATGFSVNTVSLALRGSLRIPKETRDLILAAAERLNYLPNHVARSLVSRATKTIGLVLTDIMNPTLTLAARSIERQLDAHGYSLMLAASDNIRQNEIRALDVFRSRQVDGILIYPINHHRLEHILPLREADFPVVALCDDREARIDAVAIDDRRGAFKAVSHLLELGHRRIAFLDAARRLGNSEKFEGYETALRSFGIAAEPELDLDPGGHGASDGYRTAPAVMALAPRPTALFAVTDNLAIGALSWFRQHGVSVPDDIAIVGYDNVEAAQHVEVPLTTIHYAADRLSDLAVARLLDLIATPSPERRPEVTLIEPELIVRESCGASRRRDTSREPSQEISRASRPAEV